MPKSKSGYSMQIIDRLYEQVPAFTDIFDEETWYIFVGCFVATTIVVVLIASRFITIKPMG